MFWRKFFWGKYGGQFEGKSLRTIGKNLGVKLGVNFGANILGQNSENHEGKTWR